MMTSTAIDALLSSSAIISSMIGKNDIKNVLYYLDRTLALEGDIVEMGCNQGTTSLWITRLLLMAMSGPGINKKLYVYDSFEGLPPPDKEDYFPLQPLKQGEMRCSRELLIKNFQDAGLPLPEITKGKFNEIPANAYPEKICFAFLDSDLYRSILDSLEIVVPRLVKRGIIVIHDLYFAKTPGVKKACDEFFHKELSQAGGSGMYVNT